MTLKTFGYVRLSQRGRDKSIEQQKADVRDYARDNERLQLVTTLNDGEDTSGFNTDRDKYQTLLDNIRDDEGADAVVVRDRDRLARDFDERVRLVRLFRGTSTELHVVEAGGHVDLQDEQTAALEVVNAAMSHTKKMAEIERAKKVVSERVENPDVDHGRPPFGFKFDDEGKYWIPNANFGTAKNIIQAREKDNPDTYDEIAEKTGVSHSTISRIMDRKEMYQRKVNEQ